MKTRLVALVCVAALTGVLVGAEATSKPAMPRIEGMATPQLTFAVRRAAETFEDATCRDFFKRMWGLDPVKAWPDVTIHVCRELEHVAWTITAEGPTIHIHEDVVINGSMPVLREILVHEMAHLADAQETLFISAEQLELIPEVVASGRPLFAGYGNMDEGVIVERVCLGMSSFIGAAPTWWWKRYVKTSRAKAEDDEPSNPSD